MNLNIPIIHLQLLQDFWQSCLSQVSLSHQESSISLLSLLFRGQMEWEPQSHKINQTDHMGYNLI